jgi:hypothetical protein
MASRTAFLAAAQACVACAMLLSSSAARGAERATLAHAEEGPWMARPVAITMSFGPRTPAGTWAAELEWATTRWTALSIGVGLAPSGPQVAVMPRLFSPLGERLALGVGIGVSEGRYVWEGTDALGRTCTATSNCSAGVREWSRAIWGNAELSLEERRAWGLAWRLYGGGGRILNPGDGQCASDKNCTKDSGTTVVFGGLAIGFAL